MRLSAEAERTLAHLRRLAAGDPVHPRTLEALERRAYVDELGELTAHAHRTIADADRADVVDRACLALPEGRDVVGYDGELARVRAWLTLHITPAQLPRLFWLNYALDVALCRIAGVDPPPSGRSDESDRAVLGYVDGALSCLAELEQARRRADAIGADVLVSYAPGRPRRRPRARSEALELARDDDGTVRLDAYRSRRPQHRSTSGPSSPAG